jgi:uncharacterized protein YndB with AHSA1/START domain
MPLSPVALVPVAALAALLLSPSATAAVTAVGASGFVVHLEADTTLAPGAAWTRLGRPADWWSGAHTYSGKSANLSLELAPGGCFCEALPGGGFVRHLEVAYVLPGRVLRLTGALGPLQPMGLGGALTFTLTPAAGGTHLVVDYAVAGFAPHGFEGLAGAVDGVLAEQLARLAQP